MPELSDDGLTYSFELRKDVRFNDDACFPGGKGRALVADDVIYSFEALRRREREQSSATRCSPASIEGMDAFREQTTTARQGRRLREARRSPASRKIDDQHFTIKLTQKNPLALFPLAAQPLSIVPHEAVEHYKDEFEQHPVGSGPF